MKRIILRLLFTTFLVPAILSLGTMVLLAQLTMTGVGGGFGAGGGGGGGYFGPGDVKTGAKVFYSCARGYNVASIGNAACNICNVLDATCQDVVVGASGKVTIPLIGGTDCSVSTCTVKTWYDQSGALACGGAACDQTIATITSRAVVTMSALGGLACGAVTAGSTAYTNAGSFTTLTQPYTGSVVALNTLTSPGAVLGDGAGGVGFFDNGTNWGFFASTNVSDGASDATTYHSFQMTANSTSSKIVVDSSSTSSLNAGTASFLTSVRFASDAYSRYTGTICEVGLWPGFSGAEDAGMTANQHGATNGYNF